MDKANTTTAPSDSTGEKRLLLSSLADFWSLIGPLLLAAAPKTMCEIGIGQGEFTAVLLEFCRRNGCHYFGIDPTADAAVIQRLESSQAQFFKNSSLAVLPELPARDVYFVDGDHNYYTVLNELRAILNGTNRWPLIFLHDVGWPWGRRDQYCSPETIPQEFRHPYSTSLGALPGRAKLGPGGFSGETSNYKYGAAEEEGGHRNGVLTAIEDFLREQPHAEWKFLQVPAVFGLGILCAPKKCAPEVALEFGRLENSVAQLSGFLDLLERNRLDLFWIYLESVVKYRVLEGEYEKLKSAYNDLNNHATSLQQSYESLHQSYDKLAVYCDSLLSSYRSLERHAHAVQKAHDALLHKNHD
ncbi:MAG TPA: class I SAM-dependent methyltransferase [Verrucomicrobiae bacterium]|nr:class I SAM-dependent methyltransferase [Verrucomicrobiae bacterium]